jgi:high-affinity nickel permease
MAAFEVLTGSALGSLLGMRHAFEPDHLTAVSTLVTGERSSLRAAILGASWGLGHTLSLVIVGAVLVVLRAEMPARIADIFELFVAVMLVVLGVRAISGVTPPAHVHLHASRSGGHAGRWTMTRRPLLVGAIHGLAGSGALTALVLATLSTTAARITYMTLFGIGSTVGMALLSSLLGWPLAKLTASPAITRGLAIAVGCLSIGLGIFWGYPLTSRLLSN